ncbi:MAG: hypothetical protein OXE75_02610 [bacterium]|nr:hypothetical protein [bacterium]
MTNDTAMSMRSRALSLSRSSSCGSSPILRTVEEHRRAATPNRTNRLYRLSGTRALLAPGRFSRRHGFGLYVALGAVDLLDRGT